MVPEDFSTVSGGTAMQAKAASPVLEIFEPKITGPGSVSYDGSRPLMVVRDVRSAKLERDGKSVLTLSDDFVAPQTPDPHWQVVDSNGKTYLLDRLMTKTQKVKKSVTVPDYVPDVAKVQIWCAFAETNLGEAAFEHPVK